ncbi:IS1182 family transposase [Aquibacillus albus]|uniref:Transposase n=1 Tax=Aquibacillus albus TaxID=1168171 RepID=A0ABS2N6G2_9BACI|nr:IS1182 family transposase [Aquibacillus albus]MBM7573742.1 transposase [Aquibacillus albus]
MLNQHKQLSLYSELYNKIPENHTLKLVNDFVDFSFVNELLEKSYCKYYGRPAKEPELMIKLSVLQYLYDLSDARVIEEASLNLAYMYFLGINPEDSLPHPSLLTKFRKHRLQDFTIDEVITEVVKQCVEHGIVKETNGVSIDTTHTEANTFRATPERVMKRLAKQIFKHLREENGEVPEIVNEEIPNYKEIEDHREAKETMKSYLEETMTKVEETTELEESHPKTKEMIELAREILNDAKFLESKGVRSIVDLDARVGHKTKTKNFYGYKTEYTMIHDLLITAVNVSDGAYVDGEMFDYLLDQTKKSGIEIQAFYGDKAYFRKKILDSINGCGATPYIPVSEMAYRIDEERYTYNKDSDEWFCTQGNKTVRKYHKKTKNRESYRYYFEREQCRDCPLRESCITGKNVGKILEVGINTPEFYEYSQQQKTEEFKQNYKKRACQEGKNGEMKQFHGLDRARGYGLRSMAIQAKFTALAVNLKRIAHILSSKNTTDFQFLLLIFSKSNNFSSDSDEELKVS